MAKWKRKSDKEAEINEVESSYQQYVKGKYKGGKSKGKIIILSSVISALAVVLIVFAALFYYNNWLKNTRIRNVAIGNLSLKGMTIEEATALLDEHKDELLPKNDIIVKILSDTLVITNSDVDAKLDINAIANAAYVHGRNGTDGDALLVLDPQDFVKLEAGKIRALLKDFVQPYNGIPIETSITISGERPNLTTAPSANDTTQILTITMGSPTYLCNPEGLFQSIQNAHKNRSYEIEGEVLLIEPTKVTAQSIFKQYCVSPINATMNPDTFVITEGVYGYGFDIEAVQEMLDAAQAGQELPPIPLSKIKPSVTSDTLNAALFADVLATYTAKASSQAGRDDNLKLACKAINGIILYPGDTFSYNKALGPRTAAKGYKEANTYYGGEIIKSIGGGICQVSSSLYWCAMHADLQITARTNHGRMVSYMPHGMDATVSWGEVDFCFRNNSSYPVRIEASANRGNVTVRILGTDYKDYYVKIISKTTKVTEYNEVYKEFPIDNEFGYVNDQVVSKGRTGYVFETYRCKYDKATGKEITSARVLEAVSTHKKADTIIASVPTPVPPTPDVNEPDNETPDNPGSGDITPDANQPDNTNPDNTNPDNSTPDNSTPDNSTPDNSTPDNTGDGNSI